MALAVRGIAASSSLDLFILTFYRRYIIFLFMAMDRSMVKNRHLSKSISDAS